MKILNLTLLLSFCVLSARGQNYLNIGPYSGGSSYIGRISTSGQYAELSMTNRKVSSFVNSPTLGERWLFYVDGTAADGKLRIWTGGDKVTFTKEGRVGIGTSSPSKMLDVNGDAKIGNTSQRHYLKISSSISPEVRFQTPSGDETIRLGMAQAASSYYLFDDQDFYVWTAQTNSTPLLVKQNGNVIMNAKMGSVGVGTTTPGATLDVKSIDSTPAIHVDGQSSSPNQVFIEGSDKGGKVFSLYDGNGLNTSGGAVFTGYRRSDNPGIYLIGKQVLADGLGATSGEGTIDFRSYTYSDNNFDISTTPHANHAAFKFKANDQELATISYGGNVGIGTSAPDAKLTVKGDIHAERVKVDLNIPAPDYVFEEDYELRSLEETANYIESNKHLPEIPCAKELEANGVDLVEMNMLLLKKIEEMTLHQIKLMQTVNQMNQRIEELENR